MSSSMLSNESTQQTPTGRKNVSAFAAALLVAAALPGCAVFPQSSNPSADQKITADVETSLRRHAELEPPNLLNVQTINGVVYLYGTVASGVQREEAESVANQAPGIAKVVDLVSVTH